MIFKVNNIHFFTHFHSLSLTFLELCAGGGRCKNFWENNLYKNGFFMAKKYKNLYIFQKPFL